VRDLLAINPPEMAEELSLPWRDGENGSVVAEGGALYTWGWREEDR